MANTLKSARQNVQQETPHELVGIERENALPVAIAVVLPLKNVLSTLAPLDLSVFHAGKPVIVDGDAMGVASQILQDLLWAGKRRFRVDHPLAFPRGGDSLLKTLPVAQRNKAGKELEFALVESLLEILAQELKAHFQEQAVEQAREHADGKEESRAASDPVGTAGRNSAPADEAMQMRTMKQILSPSVQDGDPTDLCAEMFGIGGNEAKGFRRGAEKNAVNLFLVLKSNSGNFFGYGEYNVEILNRQQ